MTLTLNKPAYVGMCVLDLNKVLTCEFHCVCIKNKYVNNSRLLLTDTDSFMYEIKTEYVYEDISKDKRVFDFSIYSPRSKYYDNLKKLVADKIKLEQLVSLLKNLLD